MKDFTNGKLQAAREFAEKTGQLEQFEESLKRLTNREITENVGNQGKKSEVELYNDFAPFSFFWIWRDVESKRQIMCGGLIYHGAHDNGGDGSAPTFTVSLVPQSGWSIHT